MPPTTPVTDMPPTTTSTAGTQNPESQTPSSTGASTGEGSSFRAEAQTPMGNVQAAASAPAASTSAQGSSTASDTATAPRRSGLSLRDPFSVMRYVSEEMDRMFENFGFRPSQAAPAAPVAWAPQRQGAAMPTSTSPQGFWAPKIDVARRGDNLVVCADLPGMKKEDVRVEIRDDQLVLEGERRYENEEDRAGMFRSERSYGRFYRSIPLPEGVNPEQAEAHFRDGVLEVRVPLPQWQERPGRRIEIR